MSILSRRRASSGGKKPICQMSLTEASEKYTIIFGIDMHDRQGVFVDNKHCIIDKSIVDEFESLDFDTMCAFAEELQLKWFDNNTIELSHNPPPDLYDYDIYDNEIYDDFRGNDYDSGCGEGSCSECDNYGCNAHPCN